MIFLQILAAVVFGICLGIFFSCMVFIWFGSDRGYPADPPCDVSGCDRQATRRLWDVWDHREMHVCWRCADEIEARAKIIWRIE